MEEKFTWRNGRSCIFKHFVDLVFIIKYRRGVFTEKILKNLKEIFNETCTQMDAGLLEFG